MERFEFQCDGVDYVIYVTADSDDSGQFVTFDVSRNDDGEMLNSEESKVRREFNQWYHDKGSK